MFSSSFLLDPLSTQKTKLEIRANSAGCHLSCMFCLVTEICAFKIIEELTYGYCTKGNLAFCTVVP